MPSGPIRRSQLIAPFGVGALTTARNGTSLIACGLDHWYETERLGEKVDVSEFVVREWRLENTLAVSHLRLPPDYRKGSRYSDSINRRLTVPFLRFPAWHYCPGCRKMQQLPMTARDRHKCQACATKKLTRYLVQVPFIAICSHGHVQDFPWVEWAHHSATSACSGPLQLKATGGATLAGQVVECECGAKRSLAHITTAARGETRLSQTLDSSDAPYLCKGARPWLGNDQGGGCGQPLKGSLKNASNVYFSQVHSSIYLPTGDRAPSELVSLMGRSPFSELFDLLGRAGQAVTPPVLRPYHSATLAKYTDAELAAAISAVTTAGTTRGEVTSTTEDSETAFRREEFRVLCSERDEGELKVRNARTAGARDALHAVFSRLMLVEKLKETRAFTGFTRVYPENELTLEDRKNLLWRKRPQVEWLPAYVVYGEGIFLQLNETRLKAWLSDRQVAGRVLPLVDRHEAAQQERRLRRRPISARFVLVHTFAHMLMNQLVYECGYSSAALRERLYVSEDPESPMAALLVYTASGDSEGTLGGLVRMGDPARFESLLRSALGKAEWCSADPVCMEMGDRGGQGPDSCNLAACHNCALVPETACEEFNRFLDRALLIGNRKSARPGYFSFEQW